MKNGNLNFLEPFGPLQVCNGTALPFTVWDCWGIYVLGRRWKRINILIIRFGILLLDQDIFLDVRKHGFLSAMLPVNLIESCRSWSANLSSVPFHQPVYCAWYSRGNVINYNKQTRQTKHWGAFVQSLFQWKIQNITYSECVFVSLDIQNALRMCHIFIYGPLRSAVFFHIVT